MDEPEVPRSLLEDGPCGLEHERQRVFGVEAAKEGEQRVGVVELAGEVALFAEQRPKQLLLRREVVVRRGHVHPCPAGQLAHRSTPDAALVEEIEGDLEELHAAVDGVEVSTCP